MGPTANHCMNDENLLFNLPPSNLTARERKFRERNPIWTGCKAKLIERYLFYFVQITFHGTYIDAFAGPQNVKQPGTWAAKLVMESRPRWLRNFHLFEMNNDSVELLKQLCASQTPPDKVKKEPKRRVEIYQGDFNQNIVEMLAKDPILDKEATFCLLDQRTFECNWESVRTLAKHKRGGNKVELFYFFPEGWINRSIAALKNDKEGRMEKWWGNSDWIAMMEKSGTLRANLVSERFKSEFGYKYAFPFPIYEKPHGAGKVMYYMIHASDHADAPSLMSRAYGKALDIPEQPEQLEFLKELAVQAPIETRFP